jgi:hypothetical protein
MWFSPTLAIYADHSIFPKVSESLGRKLSISDSVLDILVPEIVLPRPRILSIVGELESACMAEHVRMYAEWHLGALAKPPHHASEAYGTHGRSDMNT